MKGYAPKLSDQYVSLVNAATHFDKLGIKFVERSDPDFSSYKSALKVVVRGAEQRKVSLGGLYLTEVYPRISLINDFYFEIDPMGRFAAYGK